MKVINRIIDVILVLICSMGVGAITFAALELRVGLGSVVGGLFGVVLVVGWWLGKSGEES